MTTAITESGSHGGFRMRPSEELASRLYDWANYGLIAGLVIGVAATWLLIWMGNVKEVYLKAHLLELNTQLAKQQERAANAEAALLRLQDEHLPRMLKFESNDQLQGFIASLTGRPLPTTILYKKGDAESFAFSQDVWSLLLAAGWNVPKPQPVSDDVADNVLEKLKAQPQGVTLIVKIIKDKNDPTDPINILRDMLAKSLGSIATGADPTMPDNALKIIILQKP
jgi:hypothetical protein